MKSIQLRPAVAADAAILRAWDREPHVISAVSDDPNAATAFSGADWDAELAMQSDVFRYCIAEADGRPIGVILTIDPAEEPTHYWGETEPNLRALDIWIGPKAALGRGYGTAMMTKAIDACFEDGRVAAIIIDPLASNAAAHRFYQRLNFRPVGPRTFGDDACLVHRLERSDWEARS